MFQTGASILPDERPLSRELDRFLQDGDPPIYFGFGSTRAPQEAGRVMLQAARALGRRAIVSQGWFETSLVENEAGCLSIGEVNVRALFSRVAAVVHHGGAGTTTAAALAGAPQVVIPNHYDQHYWAQRVHALGIGTAHPPGCRPLIHWRALSGERCDLTSLLVPVPLQPRCAVTERRLPPKRS